MKKFIPMLLAGLMVVGQIGAGSTSNDCICRYTVKIGSDVWWESKRLATITSIDQSQFYNCGDCFWACRNDVPLTSLDSRCASNQCTVVGAWLHNNKTKWSTCGRNWSEHLRRRKLPLIL